MNSSVSRNPENSAGQQMHAAIAELLPICRSITGEGVRQTLGWLSGRVPLKTTETPSGTQVLDWTVPPEWNIRSASISDPAGKKVVDFADSNLHIVSYSQPVKAEFELASLQKHLHSLPSHPYWIPYRTSYYQPTWGFCLPHRQREQLQHGKYQVEIDATLDPLGSLTTGEVFLPGRSDDEVLFSCHICHPSLANDNLSSLVIAWKLIEYLSSQPRRYSYRFVFVPGTIGAITWLANNRSVWPRVKAGLVLALLGDPAELTYKRSRHGKSRIDAIAEYVLRQRGSAKTIDFAPTGYDERQYGSPGINLPVGRLSRSVENGFAEYHTSADNLDLVSPEQLEDSLSAIKAMVDCMEQDRVFSNRSPCGEPQLGSRKLYESPEPGEDQAGEKARHRRHAAMLCAQNLTNGTRGLTEVAQLSGHTLNDITLAAQRLVDAGLASEVVSHAATDARSSQYPSGDVENADEFETTGRQSDYSQRAQAVIPGGSHTYAKGDDQYPVNAPACIVSGKGCRVVDDQGREFIEYGMGLRSVALGHAYPSIVAAASEQMSLGTNFTRPATIELAAAEAVLGMLPAADMVKFAKNGSDATTAAIRLARAYTGRSKIALCSDQPFFSVDDWFISQTPMDAGIPQEVGQQNVPFRYNDIDDLRRATGEHPGEIACLIMEAANYSEPDPGYLESVQALCRQEGIVFILDEMITGFRWHSGGAQAAYGLQPDLSTFGKALGNGFAVSALAGRRKIMCLGGNDHDQARVFLLSTTHGAETHALAAAIENIRVFQTEPVVETLHQQGRKLREGLTQIAADLDIGEHFFILGRDSNLIFATLNSAGQRCQLMRTLLLQELIRRGILAPSLVVSYSHTDRDIQQTLDAFEPSLRIYRKALQDGPEKYLVGRPSQPVFRKYN